MIAIKVNKLNKTFEYYEKKVGLKGSLKNIFNRKMLVKEAVKDITFEIEQGEIVGFLGPNGAGKTTTLKMLSGILYPSNGEASVLGFVPWERKKAYKMQFSIVMGQKSQLSWDLPASESLNLFKYIYEIDDAEYKKSLDELTDLLDIKHLLNVQVRRLSLGERMKLELIAALIHRPKILFLDEPTIGLDLISQSRIRDFLKHYNQQAKTTILLTSHYMNDIEHLCKRTIVINQGKKVYDGDLANINGLFNNKKIIKAEFLEWVSKEDISKLGTILEYDGYKVTLEIDIGDVKECSKSLMDLFPIADFTIEKVPVEQGIENLYQLRSEDI